MIKLGVPAVGVASEQFIKLARTVLRSQKVPEEVAIEVKGNPEFVSDEELARIAEAIAAEAVSRFRGLEAKPAS
nr:hypothetical protein [Xenophilus azovorans]